MRKRHLRGIITYLTTGAKMLLVIDPLVELLFAGLNRNIGDDELLEDLGINSGNESVADVSVVVVGSAPAHNDVLGRKSLKGFKKSFFNLLL